MAFKDFLSKAKDMASSAASSAKNAASSAAASAKNAYESSKEKLSQNKAERDAAFAEKKAEADAYGATLCAQMGGTRGGLFACDAKQLADFTAAFYDKLYLPAHSVSASKMMFYPLEKELNKTAAKGFSQYPAEQEKPLLLIKGDQKQMVLLTLRGLYFKKLYDTASGVCTEGFFSIENIGDMTYERTEGGYVFACNGVALMQSAGGFPLDTDSFAEYIRRIRSRDFVITEEQIDAIIKAKIGEKVLEAVREYIFEDELLLYFAWGCDSVTAKDFVVCSNKQMVVLDREAFGLTKNVKQFYFEDVTSMATVQDSSSLLSVALSAAMKICNLQINVAGAREQLSNLYTYEAEKVVKVYRECRRALKDPARVQQPASQPAAPAAMSVTDELKKFKELLDMGILTQEEFDAKKKQLLGL